MPNILPISGGGGGDSAFYTGVSQARALTTTSNIYTHKIELTDVDELPAYFAIECKFTSVYKATDKITVVVAGVETQFTVYNTNGSEAPDSIFKAGVVDIIKFDKAAARAYITMPFAVYGG